MTQFTMKRERQLDREMLQSNKDTDMLRLTFTYLFTALLD